LTTNDPLMTINDGEFDYGDLLGGNTASGTFSVTASVSTPAGHMVDFIFDISANLGIIGSGEFDVVVGQIPVLILDLDPNNSSSPAMETAIDAAGVAHETLTSFPPDLNLYSSIFICLGIYSTNYTLSSPEGQDLADYLDNGGSLYLEGGDTWAFDSQTAVHTMFNINGTDDGSGDMGTVQGQTGTIAEGMSFSYSGENSWMDHLEPIGAAVTILKNQSPNYGTAIAYDEGSYKTIGTSHEFGGLDDGASPSTKEELMIEYLNFLSIPTEVQALFGSNATEVCEGETVDFMDMSSGQVNSWEWTFEGGTPGTSTEQNPSVTYDAAGVYNVELIVSDGVESSTLLLEDYISVSATPEAPGTPSGLTLICASWGNPTTYSTSGSTGASSYEWVLEPESAGTTSGNGTNITVTWASSFLGDATLKVAAENYCGTGNYSNEISISIYLPEVTLEPFGTVCEDEPAFELTGGYPEGGSYSGPGVIDGWFDPAVAGVGTHMITYTYEDANTCENSTEEEIVVDPCTGINKSNDNSGIMIFPNPNNGNFTLKVDLEVNDRVDIQIMNALNEIIYEDKNISTEQLYNKDINLSNYAKGIYYLRISGKETSIIKKIILR